MPLWIIQSCIFSLPPQGKQAYKVMLCVSMQLSTLDNFWVHFPISSISKKRHSILKNPLHFYKLLQLFAFTETPQRDLKKIDVQEIRLYPFCSSRDCLFPSCPGLNHSPSEAEAACCTRRDGRLGSGGNSAADRSFWDHLKWSSISGRATRWLCVVSHSAETNSAQGMNHFLSLAFRMPNMIKWHLILGISGRRDYGSCTYAPVVYVMLQKKFRATQLKLGTQ